MKYKELFLEVIDNKTISNVELFKEFLIEHYSKKDAQKATDIANQAIALIQCGRLSPINIILEYCTENNVNINLLYNKMGVLIRGFIYD